MIRMIQILWQLIRFKVNENKFNGNYGITMSLWQWPRNSRSLEVQEVQWGPVSSPLFCPWFWIQNGPDGPDELWSRTMVNSVGRENLELQKIISVVWVQKIAYFEKMIFEELSKCYLVLLLSNLEKVTFNYLTLNIWPRIISTKTLGLSWYWAWLSSSSVRVHRVSTDHR